MTRVGAIGHDRSVAEELRFRKDLYQGAAEDYDRFRPPYPAQLFTDFHARVPLRDDARVLDLACGTGQITFGLAAHVGEVVAIDQEPSFVEYGRAKAERLALGNIEWRTGSAEDVPLDGVFDLVGIGNAFHRLRRGAVAERLLPHLADGGCVALVWGNTPWNGDGDWQVAYRDVLDRWQDEMQARDRVPSGWEQAIERDPHAEVLRRAGLAYEGERTFPVDQRWTADSLIGLTYSTSFLSRAVLGDRAREFERDLRDRLLACRPDGGFDHRLDFAYELARKIS